MIGFYNASVILTYLGVVSAVFGMSQAFNGNFKIANFMFDDLRINRYV